MRFEIHLPAGELHHEHPRRDVPKTDLALDVGVESSTGDIRDVEGGASHHPGLARGTHHLSQNGKPFLDGGDRLGDTHGHDGIGKLGPAAGPNWSPVQGDPSRGTRSDPKFVGHRLVNDTRGDHPVVAVGDRNGKVGDAVEEVHRAVDRVDDPLIGSTLVPADPLLAVNRMIGKDSQNKRLDQRLGATVELQLDVVCLGGIDIQFPLEMSADHSAGSQGGVARRGENQFVHMK